MGVLKRQMDVKLIDCLQEEVVEGGNVMKRIGLYLAKREGDGITSSFDALKTNLFPSHSLTHAGGGMEIVGSKPVSLST